MIMYRNTVRYMLTVSIVTLVAGFFMGRISLNLFANNNNSAPSRPVISEMVATDWGWTEDKFYASVHGEKIRDCDIIPDRVRGFVERDGQWEDVLFTFVKQNGSRVTSSRPVGSNNFGIWEWHANPVKVTRVALTVYHICHFEDEIVKTNIGPFEIPDSIYTNQ